MDGVVPGRAGRVAAKILVAGAAGAGKTTFVRAASEIPPLDTDVTLGGAGMVAGDPPGPGDPPGTGWADSRATTTMGLDYGRLTVEGPLALHLFGLPGAPRAGLRWDVVGRGCAGVVVVVDGRRPHGGGPALDRASRLGVPYAVASNRFDGARPPSAAAVHAALGLEPEVPVVSCDARSPESVRACLAVLGGSLRTHLQAATAATGALPARATPAGRPSASPAPAAPTDRRTVTEVSAAARNVAWLVDHVASTTHGVVYAAAVSSEGVLLARSGGLNLASADQLAAVGASMVGLARGADRCFSGGGLHQIVTEFGRGWLVVTAVGAEAALCVVSGRDGDLAAVSEQARRTARLAAEVMSPAVRAELGGLVVV